MSGGCVSVPLLDLPWRLTRPFCTLFSVPRYRLAFATSEKLQLGSMVAAFSMAREVIAKQAAEEG